MTGNRLGREFFMRDVLEVAPELIGMNLVISNPDGSASRHIITETEAYRGVEDKASHASKGRTSRTEIMYNNGGHVYMYLIYGIHWMLNVVCSEKEVPQAALIRGIKNYPGPGRLSAFLGLDKSYYGEDLVQSCRIWIEDSGLRSEYNCTPRIGIDYAGSPWIDKNWRYILKDL